MKKTNKAYQARPWLEYYDEENIPSSIEYPDCSMVDMIMQSAEKWPDNVAYSYYGHKVTYKNFIRKIEKAARALKNYGVKEGDRVTICMPNTPEGIAMVYAVNMVGAKAFVGWFSGKIPIDYVEISLKPYKFPALLKSLNLLFRMGQRRKAGPQRCS